MVERDARLDEKVESVERRVSLMDESVFVEATELLANLLDDGVVPNVRDVLVDGELLDDSVPKVAAREVMVKVISKIQMCNLHIISVKVLAAMMPLTYAFYKSCRRWHGFQLSRKDIEFHR